MEKSVEQLASVKEKIAASEREIRRPAGSVTLVAVSKTFEATEIRPIRIGWRDGPWAEIADGLSEGEHILLNATITAGEQAR